MDAQRREEFTDIIGSNPSTGPTLDLRDAGLRHPGSPAQLPLRPGVPRAPGPDDGSDDLDELIVVLREWHTEGIARGT